MAQKNMSGRVPLIKQNEVTDAQIIKMLHCTMVRMVTIFRRGFRGAFSSDEPVTRIMKGSRQVSRVSTNSRGLPLPAVSGTVAVKIVTPSGSIHNMAAMRGFGAK